MSKNNVNPTHTCLFPQDGTALLRRSATFQIKRGERGEYGENEKEVPPGHVDTEGLAMWSRNKMMWFSFLNGAQAVENEGTTGTTI